MLHLTFFLLTGTKSSGVVRSFFRHLFQLEWKRLIEEAVRIEQGQWSFPQAQKKLGAPVRCPRKHSGDGDDTIAVSRNLCMCVKVQKAAVTLQLNSNTRFLDLVATTLALDLVVLGLQMLRVVWLVLDMQVLQVDVGRDVLVSKCAKETLAV